eukprot:m.224287 g.224287  ORF g.224287 m.224287 type:complete len:119 (-) comp13852_c2_seq26:691-1047(-)
MHADAEESGVEMFLVFARCRPIVVCNITHSPPLLVHNRQLECVYGSIDDCKCDVPACVEQLHAVVSVGCSRPLPTHFRHATACVPIYYILSYKAFDVFQHCDVHIHTRGIKTCQSPAR